MACPLRLRTTALRFGVVLTLASGAPPVRAASAPPRTIHIRNAGSIHVVLGKKREAAAGVRPDPKSDGWQLQVAPDLEGSSAELQDVTPGARANKWAVTVTSGKLALDIERFLPTHVYRVEFRRDRQVLGTALVYLYPPAASSRKARVDFADGKDGPDDSAPLAPSRKSGL